jgi:NAD-dependent dihydropyrimidine dehydrogenase PreA subunit
MCLSIFILLSNLATLEKKHNLRRENTLPHTIVTETCEGVADCVDACPVACIHPGPGKNIKGTDWYWIDFVTCIDCGICLQVCPVEGAIVPEERPNLQKTPQ